MQKRNSLIILVVFVLSISGLYAQNTGFMGKRVMVNMGAELSPAWFRADYDKFKYLSFNVIYSPSIEVITHKSGTAGVVYHYLKTRYNTPLILETEDIYWSWDIKEEQLKSHGFGIFYKQYFGGLDGRAPIGAYFKAQFDGFFFKCPSSSENRTLMMSDKLFAMKFEFGRDFLLFNRLHLSSGFSIGIPFGGYKVLFGNDLDGIIGSINPVGEFPINEYARTRILSAYWIGFTVGVGFLAF